MSYTQFKDSVDALTAVNEDLVKRVIQTSADAVAALSTAESTLDQAESIFTFFDAGTGELTISIQEAQVAKAGAELAQRGALAERQMAAASASDSEASAQAAAVSADIASSAANQVSAAALQVSVSEANILGLEASFEANVHLLSKADTAVQPEDLGTVASHAVEEFATAAQGEKADTAVQANELGLAASTVLDGFRWSVKSNSATGQAVDDWTTAGTGEYVEMAETGSAMHEIIPHHRFTSSISTYTGSGIISTKPSAKISPNPLIGGFIFECIAKPIAYAEGNCGYFGLFGSTGQVYGNFSGTDIGIGIGWDSREGMESNIQILSGDEVTTSKTPIAGITLANLEGFYLRMDCEPAGTEVRITLKLLETGQVLLDNVAHTLTLPPVDAPLYSMARMGTLGVEESSVDLRLWALSTVPYRLFTVL